MTRYKVRVNPNTSKYYPVPTEIATKMRISGYTQKWMEVIHHGIMYVSNNNTFRLSGNVFLSTRNTTMYLCKYRLLLTNDLEIHKL